MICRPTWSQRLLTCTAGLMFVILWCAGMASAAEPADGKVDFVRDIQPIFVEHCYACHGPDDAHAELRLDQRDSALGRPDRYGSLFVPGDPDGSVLIERLVTGDELMRMPKNGDPLSEEQIGLLRRWIAEGADWPEDARHWAFVPPSRPAVPEVEDRGWARTPIDHFVLARLEEENLQPSPEADRETLIRRLYLDLIGLPPEPEEVDRFVADEAPDAYERLVERLLASSHYGERWAIRWLDLARYGDTDGYDFDRNRSMWPYRDWVIRALNEDMPFSQFAVEQLAGDLLPDATDQQRLATGFIRNSPVPQYRFDMLVDRVSAVGTVFLGLTLECAQCHNHKFDPVSQVEFYRLFALFNNADDSQEEIASPLTGETAETLTVAERQNPRETFIALGGSFLAEGEPVEPGTVESLHEVSSSESMDRLAFAHWVVDRDNPLIARVTVNRQWETLFGTGLVSTSEDLGTRTEWPSHPELLDWLAVEFMDSGWSLKSIHRQIVRSATYRQSSNWNESLRERDPNNRLLARGPRFRVDAEIVRDVALTAAGVLDRRVGGASVYPYQPPGISENRERGAMNWNESEGADRLRRGMYTFWKRAALYPSLALFDAPRRETSCPRRDRSNNPLQALVTLNDPAFVEASLHLGRRMLDAEDPGQRITEGFRRCVARAPTSQELQALETFYHEELERFRDHPDAARSFLEPVLGDQPVTGEELVKWAASAMVAGVLLNLDETITKP